jgi:hypothetical protein
MSYVERHAVEVTTATGGGAEEYTPPLTGRIVAVRYVRDGTTPFASTSDFTITTEDLAQGLWTDTNVNASETIYPRVGAHDAAGAALATDQPRVPVFVAKERVKIVVAQGGNTRVGTFHVVVA